MSKFAMSSTIRIKFPRLSPEVLDPNQEIGAKHLPSGRIREF
jgi:hypothetical protein